MKRDNGPELRLIQGGHHFEISVGSYRIVAAPIDKPPFLVDAVVEEEDTFLVLSADTKVREPKEDLMRLMTRLIETRPETPGRVLVRGKGPFRFLAIIHDLNQEPSWSEEWIEKALVGIFQEAEDRKLRSIALPLIGTLHGSLEKQRFFELLRDALERTKQNHLKLIWLVVPSGTNSKSLRMIESELQKS